MIGVDTYMAKKNAIKGASNGFDILGTYEGEALDTQITNKNGLDITREVIEVVLDSDEYREGIENGWYIGFLGHPEDPNCMDFRNGCIVLTDMTLNENGKVNAKFNLIDTPVGQIVMKFQAAGVKFGISIRGAGDIIDNSVDPETFMFRGFDLVAFPAYPESIPEFHAIAASTDTNDRKKYQAVCAAVNAHLADITSCSTIDVLKTQFAAQSTEYKLLEEHKHNIQSGTELNIDKQKVEAMTELYLNELAKNEVLASEIKTLKADKASIINANRRKIQSLERITNQQISDTLDSLDKVTASEKLLTKKNDKLSKELEASKNFNLIYRQKITASRSEIESQKTKIGDLQKKLRETVVATSNAESKSSNRDAENRRLSAELDSCKAMLASYQSAFADMYAGALGVTLDNLNISASTTVEKLKDMIGGATNTVAIPAAPSVESFYGVDEDEIEDDLITM